MPSEEELSWLMSRLNEPDEYQNTIRELSNLGSLAVPALIRAVTTNSETLSVCLGAARALGEIHDERAIVPLIGICNLTDKEGDSLDYVIVPALANFGSSALPDLVAALTDHTRDSLIRAAAAWVLGMLGEPSVLELLIERLRDGNETRRVRSHAASGLGELGDRRAVLPLMEILSQESDKEVRRSIVAALGRLGDPRAVALLINILETDQQRDVRQNAARSLGLIEDEQAIRPLVEAVARESVQLEAAEALEWFGEPALHALLDALPKSAHAPLARHALVTALGHFKQEEALTTVLTVLTDEHEDRLVRSGAVWSLAMQQGQRAGIPLLALLENHEEDLLLRMGCASALGALRYHQSLPALQKILQHESVATPEENELKKAAERAMRMISR